MITIVAAATASNTNAHAADDPATPTSASSITTVFVAGATGQTGSRVVTELRKRGYKVIAGVRSPGKAASLGFDKDPGITVVRAGNVGVRVAWGFVGVEGFWRVASK